MSSHHFTMVGSDERSTDEYCPPRKQKAGCMGKRYIVMILCCVGLTAIHAMRVNVSITIVHIFHHSPHKNVSEHSKQNLPDAAWNPTMIGFLHGIFYVGFLLTQVPGGYVSTLLPGHRIFGASILLSSAFNLLLPVAISDVGFAFTCAVRFVQGLCEGFTQPSLYTIIKNWCTRDTIGFFGGIIFSGMYAGAIIGFPVDGAITHYLDWQYVYYFHGALGILWFIMWFCLVYEKPESHPSISEEELAYITEGRLVDNDEEKVKIPWKEILRSPAVWAVVSCHFVRSWMFFLLLTNEPAYLNQFHFTILENGIFSALPHVIKVINSSISGLIADAIKKSGKLSNTAIRKLCTCIGFGVEGLCCYCLIGVSEGHLAIAFLTIGVGISGFTVSGWQINHLDLAPNFASVLVGISATIGTIGGILSPIIVGIMTHPQCRTCSTLDRWQHSWALTGTVLCLGALTFFIFGSGELQQWASPSESTKLTSSSSNSKKEETSLSEKEKKKSTQ